MLNRLEMLRIFCAAAEAGSFKDAAARLGVSPQAVTRAVQELEAQQGEVLFHRNTRGVRITDFGRRLADRAGPCVQEIESLFSREVTQPKSDLAGVVSITAPSAFGRRSLMPVIARIGKQYPQIRFKLRLNDRRVDVVDEKIDIGLRMGLVRDNRFVVRQLAKLSFYVVAAPEFIARHGLPAGIADLEKLPLSAMHDPSTGRLWPWFFKDQQSFTPNEPVFVSDDVETECAALVAGMACGQLPSMLATPHLASGRLVRVLQPMEPAPWDIYLYRPQQGPVPARIRLVFDELAAAFAV